MAQRKSVVAQLYAAHQKAKLEKKKAEAKAAREYEAAARKVEADLRREQAKQERLAQQRSREAQLRESADQAAAAKRERAAAQAQKDAERERAAMLRDAQRRQAAADRERQQRTADERRQLIERRIAEAEFRTDALRRRVDSYASLLLDRTRGLATRAQSIDDAFRQTGSESLVAALQDSLARSNYPDGLRGSCAALYRAEARELLVEYELPRQDVIPNVVAYRYIKSKDVLQAEPRREAEIKKLYAHLIARVALRTLAEAFDAVPAALVNGIVFNGYVSAKDRATGKPIRPLLISTHATREAFEEIQLDEPELDPVLCLRGYLNAIVSPHPYDLEAVRPVLEFDLSRYKFVEEMDVVAGLDGRPDLLTLKPVEFEHLIRQLFEAMGMKSWVTQGSRDDGVDGVAVNPDPIVGGLCIIQAKRYSNIVGLEAVHALAGVMEDKSAAKGVLVATSWVGKASRDFAARNGRIEIIEGRQLKSLLLEHLGLDALISLPKLPPDWKHADIA
jgi:restriction system protein